MKYMTVKQAAEKWGISGTMVRRYCVQGRILKAVLKDTGWKIPENAKKPRGENEPQERKQELSPLAKKLIRQKEKKGYHGLYDYVQINLTYSSCRMASNRLTRKQVEHIFRKGKVDEMFEAMKVSDMIEAMNHIVCVDYILDHILEPLSVKSIRNLHHMLTYGTVDARMNRVEPGEFRKTTSQRQAGFISKASSINSALKSLTEEYESHREKELEHLLDFHVQFERIFPFEDCNGRVGRLILFKECLRQNVTPFILDDKRRSRYLSGLQKWDADRRLLTEVVSEAQARFAHQIEQQELLAHGKRFYPDQMEED